VVFQKPVIVYNYPKEIKAFYMRLNDDKKTVAAMDVLVPQVSLISLTSSIKENALLMIFFFTFEYIAACLHFVNSLDWGSVHQCAFNALYFGLHAFLLLQKYSLHSNIIEVSDIKTELKMN
jgi:hypothetical protein